MRKKKLNLRARKFVQPKNFAFRRNYKDPTYKRWRTAVKVRDGFTCQMPNCRCKQRGKLQVHHILKWADFPGLRFVVSNGITLCIRCHRKITGNESHYIQLFQQIVALKNKKID